MEQNRIPEKFIDNESGYHFDAVKFATFLREKFAKPKGVIHKQQTVVDILQNDKGIESIKLDNGEVVTADIYFDCTGFLGLLIDKTLNTPWISFEDKLCNNRTWAARIPYSSKEEQLKPYTTCTALSSGWVWDVPLWNRIGTGYNYCDKFISPEDALLEFKNYLGPISESVEFRDLKWPTGVREKVWNKNVVAIGRRTI
jgi:tryptophan halogenase